MKILVPTAGQSSAAETADYIMQVAIAVDAEVVALHVIKEGGAREPGELSLEFIQNAAKENNVSVECHFREGPIISRIIEFAEEQNVDLIVMGASNGRVVEQWLSSDVRDGTTIPVLVIPYQIFE